MTTPIPIYRYPLDGTGLSPDNLVVGEEHQLSTRPVRCIAPIYGGFFAESVVVKDLATDLPLIYGTDYTFGELFEFPTGRYGKEIFGLIAITKPNVAAIKINYQALGGDYAYSMDAIIQMIDSLNLGNRPVAWGEIIGHPIMFNPASHLHDIGDVYGFEYVVHSIERLRSAVLLGDVASHDEIYRYIDAVGAEQAAATAAVLAALNAHIADKNNPHATTKAQVGLGSVQNYATATQAQMDAGTASNLYVTPNIVAKYVLDKAISPFNLHTADKNNPHEVTKTQVGLSQVQNYPVANLTEAQVGTATDRYMTPQRTKDAINKIGGDLVTAHAERVDNPHSVTKAQVGLGSVQNYNTATQAQMDAGTATNLYTTPVIVAKYVTDKAVTPLNNHTADKNNPHAVTKAQTGLSLVENYPIATLGEALDSVTNFKNVFDSWLRYSHSGAVQPAIPAELNAWVYDQASDQIVSTINSSSTVGFVSPGRYGNYTFEAELSSTNTDDDTIGLVLGFVEINGVQHTLSAFRNFASQSAQFVVVVDYALPTSRYVNTNTAGMASNPYQNGAPYNGTGWSTNKVRIKAVREGNIITVWTTAVNSDVYLENAKIVIDLNSAADLQQFLGTNQLGFMCSSQLGATWKTISAPWSSNSLYVTPFLVNKAIEKSVGTPFNLHAADKNNPHGVTKAQVGLGSVDNYQTATVAEVTTGTATDRFVTPKGVKDAVTSWLASYNYDNRYVRKDANNVSGSIHVREDLGTAYVWVGGGWRQFWPPQWQ